MAEFNGITGFILAGGKSTRMGRDKALLLLQGATLLERTARLMQPLVRSVTVLGAPEKYARFGWPVLADVVPGRGPLGGLVAGLCALTTEWALFVACDLPNLDARFLRFLLGEAMRATEEAVVPETAGGLQPLCALYRRSCLAAFERALASEDAAVVRCLSELRLRRLGSRILKEFAFAETLFENINTPEEYERVRRRVG